MTLVTYAASAPDHRFPTGQSLTFRPDSWTRSWTSSHSTSERRTARVHGPSPSRGLPWSYVFGVRTNAGRPLTLSRVSYSDRVPHGRHRRSLSGDRRDPRDARRSAWLQGQPERSESE